MDLCPLRGFADHAWPWGGLLSLPQASRPMCLPPVSGPGSSVQAAIALLSPHMPRPLLLSWCITVFLWGSPSQGSCLSASCPLPGVSANEEGSQSLLLGPGLQPGGFSSKASVLCLARGLHCTVEWCPLTLPARPSPKLCPGAHRRGGRGLAPCPARTSGGFVVCSGEDRWVHGWPHVDTEVEARGGGGAANSSRDGISQPLAEPSPLAPTGTVDTLSTTTLLLLQ